MGGALEDLEALATTAEADGVFSVALATAGAFHTHLMITAALQFREALAQAQFAEPTAPVFSNYTGAPHAADPAAVRANLFFQLFRPVRWAENMAQALSLSDRMAEFGGGIGSGEDPASKRPNLKSLTRAAFRAAGVKGAHLPFINEATLRTSSAAL